jgi:hypothetical protein
MNLRKQLVALPVAVALTGMTALPAAADHQNAGAAGLVNAIIQVDDSLNDLVDVDLENVNVEVITVRDSFNNILRNARFLNNVNILQDFLNDSEVLTDFLNNADVDVNIEDVIAIDVLSDGTIVVFQR